MVLLSLKSHLEYLKRQGKISDKLQSNYAAAIARLNIDVVDTDSLAAF